MNHNCEGWSFSFEGTKMYRCLYDGTIMFYPEGAKTCPRCNRTMHPTYFAITSVKTSIVVRLQDQPNSYDISHLVELYT